LTDKPMRRATSGIVTYSTLAADCGDMERIVPVENGVGDTQQEDFLRIKKRERWRLQLFEPGFARDVGNAWLAGSHTVLVLAP